MVVGSTSSSVNKEEIFEKYTEIQILTAVFPEIKTIPWKMKSPFRNDEVPSFGIYLNDSNHVCFKDFGDPEMHGGLLDLLCKYWNCTFNQVFDRIYRVMKKTYPNDNITIAKPIKTLTRKESNELSKVQVVVRKWKDYDYQYWSSYGIEKQWLKYADVYPISHKIIIKKDKKSNKQQKYIFPADKYAYVFAERKDNKEQLKIYMPYNTKGFKWCSGMEASVWSLWTKIPQSGDNLIISSSLKDCLNLSCNLHIPAICMQGEGYIPKPQIVDELKSRFKNIIVFFDNDYDKENNPGRTNSIKLSQQYNLNRVEIPEEYGVKDPSDLYKKYGKERYMEIINSIISPVLYQNK